MVQRRLSASRFPQHVPPRVLNHTGATGPSYSLRAARVVVVRLSGLRHLIATVRPSSALIRLDRDD